MERIGVLERARGDWGSVYLAPYAGHDHGILTRQRRARQRELAGEGCHLVGADLVARLAEHIALTGDYVWSPVDTLETFRPLRDVRRLFEFEAA